MSLSFLGSGCSTVSGLRSIGIGWPSWRGMWDRSGPGSPLPENDSYAQAMHANRPGSAAGDKPAAKSATPSDGDKDSTAPGQQEAGPSGARSARRSGRSQPADADQGIQVTLGRPEPLPGLAVESPPENMASNAGSLPWRAERQGRDPASVAVVSAPADRDDPEKSAPPDLDEPVRPANIPDPDLLLAGAEAKLDKLKTYQVRISRQERVGGQLQPQEEILLSIRRDPKAVRLEWTDGASKGREVIYSAKLDPRMIFVHHPGAAVVLPAMKIPVDSPLITKNSRHKITDAGFETIVENMLKARGDAQDDQRGGALLQYKGLKTPDGFDRRCHHFVRRSKTGETWNVYLDSQSMLPRLVLAEDSRGELLERYVYHEVRENPAELASAASFEPTERWGDSKGIFSRLARAAAGSNLPGPGDPTTR
jgi:hypothetical protein